MNSGTSLPRDLPGRYGRVVADLERLLQATNTLAVVAGGWAVWHHGYAGRVTEDVDLVIADEKLKELNRVAEVCGFDFLEPPKGRWPKLVHRETQIDVDLLPEGGVPGTPSNPAPVPIGHPDRYEAVASPLRYVSLLGLIELKLGASRAKDIADIIELINAHPDQLDALRAALGLIHPSYQERFGELIEQAAEERKE